MANLGDSRVYLQTPDFLEQLTVDGDLGASLLAGGMAPEQVLGMGTMARGLRECIGGTAPLIDGRPDEGGRHSPPPASRWPLLPGDVLLFCTDGLVEEGLYLEPADVERILREEGHRSAEELAMLLANAADERQRVPTPEEPEGVGDNISCVVVKITH